MQPDSQAVIDKIIPVLQRPFWQSWDFWITQIIGVTGVLFAILAWIEAKKAKVEAGKAKKAAREAGRTVKIQSVTIELSEVAQKLERLEPEIRFNEARDLLSEVTRRLRRAISPFANDTRLGPAIVAAKEALQSAQQSLNGVRPAGPSKEPEALYNVYYAIENDLANINGCVADLLGLFEKQTFDLGEDDAGKS